MDNKNNDLTINEIPNLLLDAKEILESKMSKDQLNDLNRRRDELMLFLADKSPEETTAILSALLYDGVWPIAVAGVK